MDSTDLVTAIRTDAFLPSADATFTAARLLVEATETLHTLVERAIATSRGNYWMRRQQYTCDGTTTRFRMPTRAVAGIAAGIKLGTGTLEDPSVPTNRYRFFGDYVEFRTAPDSGQTLTIEYHLRPSRIVTAQTAGQIVSVHPDTDGTNPLSTPPYVVVNAVPNRVLGSGAPVALDEFVYIDVVKPSGWHQPIFVSQYTYVDGAAFEVQFPQGTDISEIEVGDYVRSADETDWPALPVDFHRMLATMTSAKVLTAKKAHEAAGALVQSAQPVLERFMDLITPRVKDAPPVVKPTFGILRRRGRVYGGLPR